MDLTTIFGLVASFGIIINAVGFENIIELFIDTASLKIVIGITLCVIFINKPLRELLNIGYVIKEFLFTKESDPQTLIPIFVKLSSKARKNGILALETSIENIDNEFLVKGLQLSIDGLEPQTIKEIMNIELQYFKHRYKSGADIFRSLGDISLRVGMIGTLIFLILMFLNFKSINSITGLDIASSMLPLFYGMIMAYLIYIPIGGKLMARNKHELMTKALIIEGILSISKGDNPRIVEQKLNAFISPNQRTFSFD